MEVVTPEGVQQVPAPRVREWRWRAARVAVEEELTHILALDPGEYEIQVEHPGFKAGTVQLVRSDAPSQRVLVTLDTEN